MITAMSLATLTPLTASVAALVAALLMAVAGVDKRRLAWRTQVCPVCKRDRRRCICSWR